MTNYKPKLIEVALPLVAINDACAQEKKVKHGHPSNLHLYWARRPLAAARAVLWASLVDDPSGDDSLTEQEQETERQRLFGLLSQLVRWERSDDQELLSAARAELERSYPEGLPHVVDPFGGGGAIAVEAQRLGLSVTSGDINPVALLIQRAVTEIPRRFRGMNAVSSGSKLPGTSYMDSDGLADDVLFYGLALRETAAQSLTDLYPVVRYDGLDLEPIAWIWARTVESPDPSWSGHVPLVRSWHLSKRPGKPKVWIEPLVDSDARQIRYEVRHGGEPKYDQTISRGSGICIATGAAIPSEYIKREGAAGRIGTALMAVVADGPNGRVFVAPTEDQERTANKVVAPTDTISGTMSKHPQYMGTPRYGLDEWTKLYTPRQLTALTALSDGLKPLRDQIEIDARVAGMADDSTPFREGGSGAAAYADAVITYLALTIDKLADLANSLCRWEPVAQCPRQLFGRQAVSMVWDFAEGNPLGRRSGSFRVLLEGQRRVLRGKGLRQRAATATVLQRDARALVAGESQVVVSTDPPYYDAVPYADIADFFYVWLRRGLSDIFPDECATLLTPKSEEMVADYQRHGSREGAEHHFEDSMAEFMKGAAAAQRSDAPLTVYYAYKATESSAGGARSTGWDTFLTAILEAGLQVTATWPLRTENASRLRAIKSNALASSIVLSCRPRKTSAPLASRAEFIAALRSELPESVRVLQSGNIAPVDLPQSTIGPGIQVFSRYAKVVEADGNAMTVADALAIINDELGEILDGEATELDKDTRFAITWYSQHGYQTGPSGDADAQAKPKNTSLAGITESGIGEARSGKFRLFERSELDENWDPSDDDRLTVWEATQHLVAALERSETEAADLLSRMGGYGDRARQLAYVLFQKATEKGWADEAGAYNGLITAWPSLQALGGQSSAQGSLL